MLRKADEENIEMIFNDAPKELKKSTIAAMAIYAITAPVCNANMERFNLKEAFEFIYNDRLDSLPISVIAFGLCFFAELPMLAAIIYCWATKEKEKGNHSKLHELVEFLAIGTPFALIGTAAYLDVMKDVTQITGIPVLEKVILYTGATVAGAITGFGAYKLHSFHVDAALKENGPGIKGFLSGLYKTFGTNVWNVHEDHESKVKKVLAVLNEFIKKYGILAVHGFLGNFAVDVFLVETGLKGQVMALEICLKTIIPLMVVALEGHTEARSLDNYRAVKKLEAAREINPEEGEKPVSYSLLSKMIVTFGGVLHSIPAVTSFAQVMGNRQVGPLQGEFYNAFVYLVAAGLLGYPSVYGYFATSIKGVNEALVGVKDQIQNIKDKLSFRFQGNYLPIQDRDEAPEQSRCSRFLSVFGIWQRPTPEQEPYADVFDNAGEYQSYQHL